MSVRSGKGVTVAERVVVVVVVLDGQRPWSPDRDHRFGVHEIEARSTLNPIKIKMYTLVTSHQLRCNHCARLIGGIDAKSAVEHLMRRVKGKRT